MDWRKLIVVLALAVLTALPSHPLAASPDAVRSITLFFSGYVKGTFGPCGCKANPGGGLARRSGYTKKYEAETGDYVLQVDLGNYFLSPGPHSRPVNELMVEGLRRLPLRVMNLAPEDLYQWEDLSSLELPTKFISTNLQPRDRDRPAPSPYAVIELPADDLGTRRAVRIGFLGISDPARVKPNSGFLGTDPLQAIADAQAELEGKVDFVIVLAHVDLGPSPFQANSLPARIAEAHDNVYAVLVSERRYMLRAPKQVNNAVLLSSVERGRHLGRLTFRLDGEGRVTEVHPEFIELSEKVPEDSYFHRRQLELEAVLPPEALP